ncbi:putative membrane protein [Anoxybacillus sp. B7M1]|uniref:hypothetical protein n=1 Tax=unclassified Anoxybacillus TaxID=2639704 RepID=UPI0005CD702C|nr:MULTISPECIES: hypothetical protein [unclassified Anoxybacillus]ANB56420.1 putative membrane protein [Anoxybacillus sp. B2M1]ANB65444.1 putative membrane protein [Anoxybacillus sp. B7M1]
MDEKRREIIVREIEYWKRSRLLPEQYCDYLLALYTEGDRSSAQTAVRRAGAWLHIFFILLICLLLPISVLAIYFTELSFVLQMLLLSFFILLCFIGIWKWRKEARLVHLPLIIGAFLVFLASVHLSDYYFPKNKPISALVIFLNCALWLVFGLRMRLLYLTISGVVGIALLIGSFFV